jgi:DNA topoisomerase-3
MRLFIAEKPSLGKAIAQYLPGTCLHQGGASGKGPTHIQVGNDIVTWCFGHLLEMAEPEAYSDEYKKWDVTTLPIIPSQWKLLPKEDAKKQIKVIKSLLEKCSVVVNAGDPDREGQLLVDELLEYLGSKKPVKRLWLSSLDEVSVTKALSDLRDNSDYANLKLSAEARQRSDWLVGMNLTRAYTLAGQASGFNNVLSVGRVQTPTLALVVARDLAIENFKSRNFYSVTADINCACGITFRAKWLPSDSVILDESKRLLDKSVANKIVSLIKGLNGKVTKYETTEKKQPAPLPFSLSKLQTEANKRFGLGAQAVLDIAQSLYEAKLTTYPRTDCQYLPESQHRDASKILESLADIVGDASHRMQKSLRSSAWNDKKVTAHHAIIPTGQRQNLQGNEARIYELIVQFYAAQFLPEYRYQETEIVLSIAGETFSARGKTPVSAGWRELFNDKQNEEEKQDEGESSQPLPTLQQGESIKCQDGRTESKKTTPPAHFTEGSLIQTMTNIHNIVVEPELKKRLKETAGIGTEATRAGIIETLKKRKFIIEQKKNLVSTETGRKLISALPDAIISPGLTGLFEQALEA